jgi:hypothetical protein
MNFGALPSRSLEISMHIDIKISTQNMKYNRPFRATQYGADPCSRIHCHSPKPALVPTKEAVYPLTNQSSNFSTIPQSALTIRCPEQASRWFVSVCSFWAVRVPEDGFSYAVQRAEFYFTGMKAQLSGGGGRIEVDHNTGGGGSRCGPSGSSTLEFGFQLDSFVYTYMRIVDHAYTQFRPAPNLPECN